ncbi:MAG: hypothetical protein ABNH00_01775 [Dokdonia sp.]|jgi:ABC-type multidrug transport system fused ATPase/permease subunit
MNWIEFTFECLAMVTGLATFYKYKHKPIRIVALILVLTVIAETAARWYIAVGHNNNHWIYNLYAFVLYALLYKMVFDHITNSTRKKIVGILSILMLIAILIRAATTAVITTFMAHTYNISAIVLVVLLMYYAIDRLKSNDRFEPRKNLEIYVFGAYMLFGVSFIPLAPLVFGIWLEELSLTAISTLSTIHGLIVILMNLILIYGFLWVKVQH